MAPLQANLPNNEAKREKTGLRAKEMVVIILFGPPDPAMSEASTTF